MEGWPRGPGLNVLQVSGENEESTVSVCSGPLPDIHGRTGECGVYAAGGRQSS